MGVPNPHLVQRSAVFCKQLFSLTSQTIFKSPKIITHLFFFYRESGEGRERKRERNIDVREKLVLVASHAYLSWELDLHPRHVPDLT